MSTVAGCPACTGLGVPLGNLGRLRWYRCRACGIDFSRTAPPHKGKSEPWARARRRRR